MLDTLTLLSIAAVGVGLYQLMQLQERLHRTEAKLDALLRRLGVDDGEFAKPSDRIRQLAKDPATRIQAIKAYREQTGMGLKDAKEVIERLAIE